MTPPIDPELHRSLGRIEGKLDGYALIQAQFEKRLTDVEAKLNNTSTTVNRWTGALALIVALIGWFKTSLAALVGLA